MRFLSSKAASSIPPCKDFSKAWLRCLHFSLPSVPSLLAGAVAADCGCGQSRLDKFPAYEPHSTQRVTNVFYLLVSVLLKPLLECEYNLLVFPNFKPQPSCHTHCCDPSCYLHSILSHPHSSLHSTKALSYCLKFNQTSYKYVAADTFCSKFCEHKQNYQLLQQINDRTVFFSSVII